MTTLKRGEGPLSTSSEPEGTDRPTAVLPKLLDRL